MPINQTGRLTRLTYVFALLALTASSPLVAQESSEPAPAAQEGAAAEQPKPEAADPATFPDVVARVNGVDIPKRDLLDHIEVMRFRVGLPDSGLPIEIYRSALDDVIGMELLFQLSKKASMAATTEEIDQQFAGMQSQFPSQEEFQKQLESEGMTPEGFKAVLMKEVSIRKFVVSVVAPKVTVDEASQQAFYEENKGSMEKPLELKVRHILLGVQEGAAPEEKEAIRTKLEGLRTQVVDGGADFAALASEHSDDSGTKAAGGELTIRRGQTVPPFEEAAFAIADAGSVSPVIETTYGYHIIQLVERLPARTITFEEAQPRIEMFLRQQNLQKQIQAEVEQERTTAQVEILL